MACLQDMFVDFDLAQGTAGSIKGIRQVCCAAAAAPGVVAGSDSCLERLQYCAVLLFRAADVQALALNLENSLLPFETSIPPLHHPPTHPSDRSCRALLPATPQWITNEYLHCGIREAGVHIFEKLLNMARGGILLR